MRFGVEDGIRVVDHLGVDRFAVIGVSAGGPPALAISATHPEHVRATVLVAASGPYDDEAYMHEGDIEHRRRLLELGRDALVEEYEAERAGFLADPLGSLRTWFADLPAAELNWFTEPPCVEVALADITEALTQGARGWLRETQVRVLPWTFDVATLIAPVRAFHGDRDSFEKLSNLQRTLAPIRDHAITVYAGGDHLSPWLHADDFMRATRLGILPSG